jgi:hypothetical protein
MMNMPAAALGGCAPAAIAVRRSRTDEVRLVCRDFHNQEE